MPAARDRPDAPGPLGLMFHRFHADGASSAGQGSLGARQLEEILGDSGPDRIRTPGEWLDAVARGSLAVTDRCITFDDGLRSQLDVALPVLDALGLKAFWFVYSSVFEGGIERNEVYSRFATTAFAGFDAFVDAFFEHAPELRARCGGAAFDDWAASLAGTFPFYSERDIRYRWVRLGLPRAEFEAVMDAMIEAHGDRVERIAESLWLRDADLRRLVAEGHAVGLHSYDHPVDLAGLPAEEQRRQYELNFAHLHAATGVPPRAAAHPLGSYSAVALQTLEALGIACGFRSSAQPVPGRGLNPSPLEMAREDAANLVS